MLKQIASRASNERDVSVGRTLSIVGLPLAIAVGTFLASIAGSRTYLSWELSLLLFVALMVGGMYAAQAFYELNGWIGQRGRDLAAGRIWAALKIGRPPPEPFTLYLRPFASTDNVSTEVDRFIRMRPVAGGPAVLALGSDRLEFEAEVEQALRPIGPLVALGQPLEHIGAGRIRVSDDEWQRAVEQLMDDAALIVLLPSSRPGTTWEVKTLLKAGRLAKTIVVDPPDHLKDTKRGYDPVAEWREVRRSFAVEGYQLPPSDPDGLLLYFGAARTPVRSAKIFKDGTTSVRAFAAQVITDIEALRASRRS